MATDRPRLQAYLDPELHQAFSHWKQELGIAKDSEALNYLLAEYFGVASESFPIPNSHSSITTEQIEEMIEEKVSQIKRELAEKLPSRSEIDRRVTEEINTRIEEQSEFWHNKLAERIYVVEQRLNTLKQKVYEQFDFLVNRLPESPPELPSESLKATRSPSSTARHENITSSPEAISRRVIEAIEGGKVQEAESKSELPSELNLTRLARRLNISKSVVSGRKTRPDFEEWSKGKDPDAIAWRYDKATQKFRSPKA